MCAVGVGQLVGNRHLRRHVCHHLDERQNRENECRGGLYRVALLGMAMGGLGGLLLAIPIIGIVNVVSQHIEELQPLAELLRK